MPDCHPTWELFLPQPVAKFHWKIPRCRGSTRTKSIVPDHDTRHPPDRLWWGRLDPLGARELFFLMLCWREWRTLGSFLFEEDLAFKISFRWFGCVFLFTHCNRLENGNLNIRVFNPSYLRNNFNHALAMSEEYHRFLAINLPSSKSDQYPWVVSSWPAGPNGPSSLLPMC